MPASLRGSRSARTVLLRMAADQDRAERIRLLKAENPGLTWRAIADHVGVTERAAADWAKSGGIAYENAKKLAGILGVEADYIWRGNESAPDPFARPASADDDLHEVISDLADHVAHIDAYLANISERVERNHQLIIAVLESVRGAAEAAGFQAPPLHPAAERILGEPSPARPERKRRNSGSPAQPRRRAG